jgi:hypothetical protein
MGKCLVEKGMKGKSREERAQVFKGCVGEWREKRKK